jgi:microcystin-dependent protein
MSGLIPPSNFIPGEMPAPPGTRIAFNQAAAPLGWTTDTSAALSDCSCRTMTDTSGGATGGSTNWSGWNFGGSFSINAYTISTAQMPVHNHAMSSSHAHSGSDGRNFLRIDSFGATVSAGGAWSYQAIGSSNASSTGVTLQNNGSGSSVTTTYVTPQLKFIDICIGLKS